METNIKQRVKLTYVELKDGRILTTDATPDAIYKRLENHSHILIGGEMHSKFSIVSATPQTVDDVEALIKMQSKEIQDKMREKKKRLKQNMGKEMSLSYAQNYLANLLANYGNN